MIIPQIFLNLFGKTGVSFFEGGRSMNEGMLIQKLKNGDEKAFWELQSKYREDIYRAAFSVVENREDTLDVCQNVLLKVWQRIGQYEPFPDKPFGAWLYTVTKNEAKNFLRNKSREQTLYIGIWR